MLIFSKTILFYTVQLEFFKLFVYYATIALVKKNLEQLHHLNIGVQAVRVHSGSPDIIKGSRNGIYGIATTANGFRLSIVFANVVIHRRVVTWFVIRKFIFCSDLIRRRFV